MKILLIIMLLISVSAKAQPIITVTQGKAPGSGGGSPLGNDAHIIVEPKSRSNAFIIECRWVQVKGPSVPMSQYYGPDVWVLKPRTGDYVFRATVRDSYGLTGFSDVSFKWPLKK